MLNEVRVFIAEDEPFIALDLVAAVEDAQGTVTGPAGSIREALPILQCTQPHVGLLDAHLSDGEITPIAELLINRGVPILFYCGGLTPDLKMRHPNAGVFIKPLPPIVIVHEIAALMHR